MVFKKEEEKKRVVQDRKLIKGDLPMGYKTGK